ncbi:hypothetical protein MHU86_1367 [Fragilaria crotonensis]|nr:hypothetical protein MHU86_1367 [Fragilaria crotonensis]
MRIEPSTIPTIIQMNAFGLSLRSSSIFCPTVFPVGAGTGAGVDNGGAVLGETVPRFVGRRVGFLVGLRVGFGVDTTTDRVLVFANFIFPKDTTAGFATPPITSALLCINVPTAMRYVTLAPLFVDFVYRMTSL